MEICRICASSRLAERYQISEKMLGLGEVFEYFRCADCGCVQIAEFPADLGRFYPNTYYSLARRSRLSRIRSQISGRLVRVLRPLTPPAWRTRAPYFAPASLGPDTPILEVGCGRGDWLVTFYRAGFSRLHGIDPFMAPATERQGDLTLERANLSDLQIRAQRYGFIYFSHSLEHMPDQQRALAEAKQLLADGGTLLIRIPWVSCEAWERYQENWVQWDAPRHFYLHSRSSFELLVASAGLRIEKLWCDSSAFQFWGSEQYIHGTPLFAETSYIVSPTRSRFTKETVQDYEARAAKLNAEERGDQICAWLVAR